MALALFDMDDTLLDGDSASLWFEYMVDHGLAPAAMLAEEAQMMTRYYAGELDMGDYMNFTLQPLAGQPVAAISAHCAKFAREVIGRMFVDGLAKIRWHSERGDTVIIISATGEHVVRPIAALLGVEQILAINLGQQDGCYTGLTTGVLSFREGKVTRTHDWLAQHGGTLEDSYGYSDSINDLPLLQMVTHAHAINPGEALRQQAMAAGWPVLHWQDRAENGRRED